MSEFMKTLLPAIVILAFAFAGLAITMLVRKGGKFPNTHIHGNKYLNDKGVNCVRSDDRTEQEKAGKQLIFKNMKYIRDKKIVGKK